MVDYLPKQIAGYYKDYMRSPHLDQGTAIPIWNPSLIQPQHHNVKRRIRLDVGDVGTFTMRGGFQVAFNILLDKDTNASCDYAVPENFTPFTYEEANNGLRDNGKVIDVDHCRAIHSEVIPCRNLAYGFRVNRRNCLQEWAILQTSYKFVLISHPVRSCMRFHRSQASREDVDTYTVLTAEGYPNSVPHRWKSYCLTSTSNCRNGLRIWRDGRKKLAVRLHPLLSLLFGQPEALLVPRTVLILLILLRLCDSSGFQMGWWSGIHQHPRDIPQELLRILTVTDTTNMVNWYLKWKINALQLKDMLYLWRSYVHCEHLYLDALIKCHFCSTRPIWTL